MKEIYATVAGEGEAVIVEKKSKFIASVSPAETEAEALCYLGKIRSKYPDARHNVYAYVIAENNISRYSDDGEPSGTAGMPVLDAVRGAGLVNTIVVVTRYFGGTLLGTGGLVRAYGLSAKKGLEAAGMVTRRLCDIVSVRVGYDLIGRLQYALASEGFSVEDALYEADALFFISSPKADTARLSELLIDITGGRAEIKITDEKYIDKEI